MGVESVGVEATPHVPGPRFPNLTDRISRPSGTFADGLESKGPKLWADVNRKGPYVFGSSMAPTPKASNSEGSNSEGIQHSSDKIRFGGIPSSLSSIGGGYASRTVSVSELFAHRNRAGKSTGKQKPTVTIDPGPITSAFSTFSLSTSGSTNPNDSTAASSVHLKPDSSVPTSADGRRFSAVSEDSRYPTPSLSTFGTGSNSKASSSLPQQFVFSAGTGARTDSFKPATPDSSFSGSFVTTTYFSVPSSTPSGPPELSTQSNVNVETTYAGLSKATKEANVPLEKVFPLGAATSVASASSEASVPFNGPFVTDQSVPADIASKLNQLDIDQGFNLPPKFTKLDLNKDAEKTVETTSFVVPNIEQKLKKLDIDQGASLSEKLSKLGVNKCQKDSLGTSSCVFGTQGANGIESDDSTGTSSGAPFVFGATATSSAHPATVPPTTGSQQPETVVPNFSSSFKFSADGETKQPASKVKKDKHRPLRPGLRPKSRTAGPSPQGSMETTTPSPNREAVSMDFSPQNSNATTSSSHSGLPDFHIPFVPDFDLNNPGVPDGETRPPVSKLKKDKHRPLRQGLRSKGRSTTTSSRGNFEATTSREGRSAEFSPQDSNTTSTSSHSRFPDFSMPRVPNFDLNNPVVPPLSEQGGLNSRASAFELNLGTKSDVPKGSSSSFSSFRFEENDSLLGQKHDAEPSSSAGFGQTWKRAPSSDVQAAASSDYDSGWGEQADTINESTDVSDPPDARGRNDGIDRTDRESEAGRSSEDANCSGAGTTSRIELDGKPGCSPFMFSSSSPSGMSNSNLRRRARKVQREKSGVRVVQAEKPAAAVLEPDTSNARPFSSRSDNWSGLPGLGGLGYGDGVNTSMGVGTIAAEQVCERWRLRGNQAYAKGDFVKAEEFYSLGAGSVSPNETSESCIRASVLCYSNRAATRMVVGRMREALADCMHAMAVDPSFFRVHLRAASCYLVLGEIDLAATAFKECLTQAKESKKLDSKVLADASEGLKKAQQVVEYSAQVRKLLQNNSSGDAVTVLRLLNEALLTSSQSEWLLELKAYALISLQRYSEAVQLCDQTLALAQQNHVTPEGVKSTAENTPLSWRRRITAKAYFHLGKLEESLEQLQQLHEGPSSMFPPDPDSPGALSSELTVPSMTIIRDLLRHKLEGNKAFQAGKHAEALEHYSAALARNAESRPFCAVCLCNRAAASQALGHIADAIADCSRAIALDPRYAKAISRRAALHEKVRDYGQSCNDLRRLIALYERHLNSQRTGSLKSTSSQDSSTADELQQAKDRLMKSEEELKKGHPLDHYSILGLELGCSVNEIKKAYRKAALRHHPDKAGQFLVRSGDIGDDVGPWKDATDENVRKDGEKLIDEVRKDSEQLFKLIGEAYAVLSDPSKRSRYDAEEELRKLRTRTNDLSKNVFNERKHSRTNDGTNGAQFKGAWSSSNVGGEAGNQSRANRQRERWDGFNYQYQRWHPGPDAAQPDIYARRGQPTGSNYGSSHRSNPWRWEEYPWDDV